VTPRPLDDLVAVVAEYPLHDHVLALSYLAIAVFVAVDVVMAARRDPDRRDLRRREAKAAIGLAAGALVVGLVYGVVFAGAWSLVAPLAPSGLVELWDRHPVAAFVVAFVAWDLGGWIYHLIGHRTRIGWAAHAPHHTARDYNGSLALRQSWTPFHGLAHQPLLALTGVRFSTFLVCIAVSNLLQALQHCSVSVPLPRWVRAVFVTPEAHRHHHLVDGGSVNLGPVLTVWDRLAGTWRAGPVPPTARYGHAGVSGDSVWGAATIGWRDRLLPPMEAEPTPDGAA
jgi:alkylglycerol monooxygenase